MSEGAARSTMGAILSPINKIGEIGTEYVRDNMFPSSSVADKINKRLAEQEAAKKSMEEPRETILTSGVE